jgi:hypothetical protein
MWRQDRGKKKYVSWPLSSHLTSLSPDEIEAERFHAWDRWGVHVPLELVVSPDRPVVGPIVNYLAALHAQSPEIILTVVVPEIRVPRGGTVSSAIIWASGCVGRSSTMPALRSPRCPFN